MTAFAHEEPDSVPAWCGASPEFLGKAKRELGIEDTEALFVRFGDDFRRVSARLPEPEPYSSPEVTYRTVFGIERRGFGYGMPLSHPLQDASLAEVHAYPWPAASLADVSHIREDALAWRGRYAVLGGDWSPFWHDAIDLMGMENLLYAMHDEPETVDAVLTHLVDYYSGASARVFDAARGAIDIFFIGNDFGSQTGPLISRAAFHRFLFPHLQRLCRLGHDYRLKVMMHCCGNYALLIPDMIDAGLDGLQAVQPCGRGMEPETLKAAYGDKMVFNGCIDSHHVLIKGTPDFVRRRTAEVMRIMKPGGGYILSASHDYILDQTPVENVLAMFDVAREYR